MENWQLAEKHQKNVKETQDKTCVVKNGFVCQYNGKAFFAELKKLGHDDVAPAAITNITCKE